MTYQQIVDAIAMRIGGGQTLARIFPKDAEVDLALDMAQQQVADEMTARFGFVPVYDLDHELADPINTALTDTVYAQLPTAAPVVASMAGGNDPSLPECYHMALMYAAALLLANKMGDNMPTFTNPQKMYAEYQAALKRGHKVYALTLYANAPDRILDGYKPLRHYEEEF